jgi:VWFA-related protein
MDAPRNSKLTTLVLIMGVGLSLSGMQREVGAPPTFRSAAELVVLQVKVADRRQRPVKGLDATDFVVLEDGARQKVSYFLNTERPLDIALVLDASSSMSSILPKLRGSAQEFVDTLRPGDQAMIVGFADRVRVLSGLTGRRDALRGAIDRLNTRGATSLYDGLYIATKTLAAASPDLERHQAVIMLSDGQDTSSLLSAEDVRSQSIRAGIPVYAMLLNEASYVDAHAADRLRSEIQRLARGTGGATFEITDANALPAGYRSIARELSQQYVLAYISSGPDRKPAQIVVQIPSHPTAVARTHVGYTE